MVALNRHRLNISVFPPAALKAIALAARPSERSMTIRFNRPDLFFSQLLVLGNAATWLRYPNLRDSQHSFGSLPPMLSGVGVCS